MEKVFISTTPMPAGPALAVKVLLFNKKYLNTKIPRRRGIFYAVGFGYL
jgi:hypothetical protein